MREINFRAWDKETNIMVYSDHRTRKLYDVYYGFEMNGEGELECRWEGEFTESHVLDGGMLDNLMQYTGLKDMNGVEIYEGDIVAVSDGVDSYVTNVYWGGEEYPAFDLNHRHIPSLWYYESNILSEITNSELEEIQVIGNIYENPELLEDKQ